MQDLLGMQKWKVPCQELDFLHLQTGISDRRLFQLCEHMMFPSSSPVDGTLQRYCKFPSDKVYKLPDHLTLEDGAMVNI